MKQQTATFWISSCHVHLIHSIVDDNTDMQNARDYALVAGILYDVVHIIKCPMEFLFLCLIFAIYDTTTADLVHCRILRISLTGRIIFCSSHTEQLLLFSTQNAAMLINLAIILCIFSCEPHFANISWQSNSSYFLQSGDHRITSSAKLRLFRRYEKIRAYPTTATRDIDCNAINLSWFPICLILSCFECKNC